MIKSVAEKIKRNTPVKLVFFGDSVTHGYFESFEHMHGTTCYDSVYHNRLKKLLDKYFPENQVTVVNSGVGGETSGMGLRRIDKDVLAYNPDLVVVCFGLNDIHHDLSEYMDSLTEIFSTLKNHNIPCIFMTPNMLNTAITKPILRDIARKTMEHQNSGRMDEFMSSAINLAEEMNVTVCDCYSVWKDLNTMGIDTNALLVNGINHPIREMHALFAHKLFETIFKEK